MRTSHTNKPSILITMGDPAGIGPEVIVKSFAKGSLPKDLDVLVIGDSSVLRRTKNFLDSKANIPLLDLSNISAKKMPCGVSSPSAGRAAIGYIDKALDILKKERRAALVTAPVNKHSINLAGVSGFNGHTDYLAEHTGTKDYAMMLVGEKLKVTLVTVHKALRDVPGSLTIDGVYKAIMITHKYLKEFFRVKTPRIGVAGLNPHAGDEGLFGDEEERIIIPAIRRAVRSIRNICGPIAADALFYETAKGRFDAAIAMYHDQGLGPFKTLYFRAGVNLTLGLPFIRTSPDHGTAFDIAGKGKADPSSMIEAIRLASRLLKRC